MALKYILDEVASATGLKPDTNPDQRKWLLRKINRGAREVYESEDLPGCYRESYILATPNTEIALPHFVGNLRAVREADNFNRRWSINDMIPRYHTYSWPNQWTKFIFKGTSPLKLDVTNATPPKALIQEADTGLEVTIVGSISGANRVAETVIMDATTKNFTKSFLTYESISQNRVGTFNVSIQDQDGNELAVLYNDKLESIYSIYDVSNYPFGGVCNGTQRVMEILYKLPLQEFVNDTDTFVIEGFDDVIVGKTLQLITELEEGKEDRAVLIDQRVLRMIKQKIQAKTGQVEKKLNYARRGTLGLFSPYNYWE